MTQSQPGPGRAWTVGALALILTVLTVAGVAGSSRFSGPVLFAFGESTHGVHRDDLLVLAIYLSGLSLCWTLRR